jgi:hypothetical protein
VIDLFLVAPDGGAGFRERLMSWSPPEPFPADLLSERVFPADPEHAVELTYQDGELTGKAGRSEVSVALPRLKWQRRATLAGSVGGRPMLAKWRVVHVASRGGSDGYAAGLSGSLAGEVLDIEALLYFDPSGYPFSRAIVAGELSGLGLEAHVIPAEATGGGRAAYVVSGGL